MQSQITTGNTPDKSATRFLQTQNVSRTMSSREIADLTGKRHDNVMQVIRSLAADQILTPESQESSFDHRGNTYSCWDLSKRDSLVLVARLSPEFTARIVDRWMELEEQVAQQFQIPATYAEALQIAADQAKENQHLQSVILQQAPKVAAIKRLAAAEGAICITDAAKHLQIRPKVLFDYLALNRWIYRRGGSSRWIGMEPRITSGFLVHKVTSLKPDAETGAERAAFQPLITPKGLARLAEKNIGASL